MDKERDIPGFLGDEVVVALTSCFMGFMAAGILFIPAMILCGIFGFDVHNAPNWVPFVPIGIIFIFGSIENYKKYFPSQAVLAVREERRLAKLEQERLQAIEHEKYLKRLAELKKKVDWWWTLNGWEFELEVAKIYDKAGYRVEVTTGSGDKGIDIVLHKDGKKTVVQCKHHHKPIGPGVARELVGAMALGGAKQCILIGSGGFTKGVYEVAAASPMQLYDIKDIIKMNDLVEDL